MLEIAVRTTGCLGYETLLGCPEVPVGGLKMAKFRQQSKAVRVALVVAGFLTLGAVGGIAAATASGFSSGTAADFDGCGGYNGYGGYGGYGGYNGCDEGEGRMTGGGTIDGTNVRHGFTLHCNSAALPNQLQVNMEKGDSFKLDFLSTAECLDDPEISSAPPEAEFNTYIGSGVGTCRVKGKPSSATAEWVFTDAGEPGSLDFMSIKITGECELEVSGLVSGNHQAHKG